MTPRRRAATVSLLGALWGCSASKEPTGSLMSIDPAVAYNNVPISVVIGGEALRPAYSFDTMAGATAAESGAFAVTLRSIGGDTQATRDPVPLQDVMWKLTTKLEATIPAGVDAGAYDVVVTDPRGQETVLHQAFTSLGPDDQAPILTIVSPQPRTIIGAMTTIPIVVWADDGYGFVDKITVAVRTAATSIPIVGCGGPAAHQKTCPLDRTASIDFPAPLPVDENDMLTIEATAIDSLGNEVVAPPAVFRLAPRPFVSSVSPSAGPAVGGTELVVTGADFVIPTDKSNGSALLVDGVPLPYPTVTPNEIRAFTQRHDPGVAMVQVTTGTARTTARPFEFVAAPSVKLVIPAHGPVTGGTWIAVVGNHFREGKTTITVGGEPLGDPCFVSANRIEGRVPAGAAVGSVAVSAQDGIGGSGTTSFTFTYDTAEPTPSDPPDGGLEPPQMLCPGVQ